MKRPVVWVAGILFATFFVLQLLYGRQLDKQYYVLDSCLEDSMDVVVCGTLSQIDTKPHSFYYFLKNVSLQPKDREQTFYFSDFLVIVTDDTQYPKTKLGNLLTVSGSVSSFAIPTNPGQFNEKEYYKQQNIYYKMTASSVGIKSRTQNHIKQALFDLRNALCQVFQRCMSEKNAGILSAMLLGERSLLDTDMKDLYQANGIGHILAISGLHLSILSAVFYWLLQLFSLPRPLPCVITAFFLAGYAVMTGFGISAGRAVCMMLFLLLGRELGRSYDALTALAFSAILTLLHRPYAVCSSGFLLSYSAVLGCIVTYPALKCFLLGNSQEQKAWKRRRARCEREQKANSRCPKVITLFYRLLEKIISSLLFSSSICITTLPVVLYFFYEVPTYSILLNLLVLPFVSVLLVLALLGGIGGLLFLPLGQFFLTFAAWLLNGYEILCSLFLKLPSPIQILGRPSVVSICCYVVLLAVLLLYWTRAYYAQKERHFRGVSVLLLAAAVFALIYRKPNTQLILSMMDVGQGDGILLQTTNGKTILIDGGSSDVSKVGKYRILPFLKYYGISKIDYMIMTHSDEDHISGQLELLEDRRTSGIQIGCCLLPSLSEEYREEKYTELQKAAASADIQVKYLQKGSVLQLGALRLDCLHPQAGFAPESANAASTVLSLSYGSLRMLLTGDLEKSGEEAVREELIETYDILKVAHHGSKNSTSEEFLTAAVPKVSLISCGKNNRYGHPHQELLTRLSDCGSQVFQTAESGAIQVYSDGQGYTVRGYGRE